jgi:hypothetical protein
MPAHPNEKVDHFLKLFATQEFNIIKQLRHKVRGVTEAKIHVFSVCYSISK